MKEKLKNFLKKLKPYESYIVYGGFIFIFLLFVVLATTYSEAPYNPNVLGTSVGWYATFILTGILFALVLGYREFRRFKVDPNILQDGLIYCLPLAIIGARLWYVIFNLDAFMDGNGLNFLKIIGFDQSGEGYGLRGLAIHGAFIFTVIFAYFFTKKRKVSSLWVLDVVAPGFLIGQTLGRWGNFMNQELFGPVVDNLNWLPRFIADQMRIQGEYHHPTFLYESVWNLIALILILTFRRTKLVKVGDIIAFYLVWYGIGRIPVELLRIQGDPSDPLMMGGIPVSILISVILIVSGLTLFILNRLKNPYLINYDDYNQKCVLFDLDGTLLDTKDVILKNLQQTIEEIDPKLVLTEDEKIAFIGPTLEQSFLRLYHDQDKIDLAIKTYKKYSRLNNQKGVLAFDGVKECLKQIQQKGYSLGVVSSKKNELVRLGLTQNGLLDYFDVIIGADDIDEHKPSPAPLLKALKVLGVTPNNAIYVGDHPNDIIAAKAAMIQSVGVTYTVHLPKLMAEQPDVLIDSLEKLPAIL